MTESPASFREQVVAALPRLRRFARALTKHPEDADDLVQIAVERALLRSHQWRPGWSVVNWMVGIVRHAWIDEVRARRQRSAALEESFVPDEGAAAAADANVDRLSIQSALARLPDEQRLAVALVLVAGLSYKEAADQMGTPVGTLTSRLARARMALGSMLGDADGTSGTSGSNE